ncbi:hypothetical protein K1T71_003988 [Dendrolimus kikuchii]|uniref:Uncharacterized protein n=1 Tax=Dendrolimus kikuchii TaxID=765133 RepID=A0ACC1D9I5_9NEOP|nr:hypothetical protein K1T71_003988 [Dendrolimus kikuchii]
MPVCSVIGCGIKKTPNQPTLTIHSFPRNERKKKKWLEAIGLENIKPNVKDIYICSLHFDDKCFNKTLDVPRLRDDAVPFKFHPVEETSSSQISSTLICQIVYASIYFIGRDHGRQRCQVSTSIVRKLYDKISHRFYAVVVYSNRISLVLNILP